MFPGTIRLQIPNIGISISRTCYNPICFWCPINSYSNKKDICIDIFLFLVCNNQNSWFYDFNKCHSFRHFQNPRQTYIARYFIENMKNLSENLNALKALKLVK